MRAPRSVSRRSFVVRFEASGPWQVKHLSEKIGRMSLLKRTVAASARAHKASAGKKSVMRILH